MRVMRYFNEWPTLGLILFCYGAWYILLQLSSGFWSFITVPFLSVLITLHSSLQHEALHGHPFSHKRLNEALVFIAIGLFFPYGRFRDLHLEHHQDARLTDPYDDPESFYLDGGDAEKRPGWQMTCLEVNNTLAGRMLFGPFIGSLEFYRSELRLILKRTKPVIRDWILHILGTIPVIWLVIESDMPLWAYLISCYLGFSILRIRTFAEHQAHEKIGHRSIIVEDRGILALLFLNNNFHAVHHAKPKLAWYKIPKLYEARKRHFVNVNGSYLFPNYGALFKKYLFKKKEPVIHPLWRRR